MSKKFVRSLIKELQSIRYKLEDLQNCEDSVEMIICSLELAVDLEQIEEQIQEKFDI